MLYSGIVLNGGSSSRMGSDKAEIMVQGKTIMEIIIDALTEAGASEILIIGGSKSYEHLSTNIRNCDDLHPHEGPLGGLITGLSNARYSVAMVLACDYLTVTAETILECLSHLSSKDMISPIFNGKEQFLFSAVQVNALPVFEQEFNAGTRSMHDAIRGLQYGTYQATFEENLRSVNTPSELNE